MRIAIDGDSVLWDPNPVWAFHMNSFAAQHGHSVVARSTAPETWNYYPSICRTCFRDCVNAPELVDPLPLNFGSIGALRQLVEDGHTLHLVTHRPPELEGTIVTMLEWHGIAPLFHDVFVGFEGKDITCQREGLDVLIDDKPKNLEDVRQYTAATVVCFDQPYNRDFEGLRVYEWNEIPSIVTFIRRARAPHVPVYKATHRIGDANA